MKEIKLSPRLLAAAELVGHGSVADIGTDHALLPIHLVQKGHPRALASDINEGPCQRARTNIYAKGLHSKIKVVCCPGLDAVDEFAPDNIVIAGMGGEMIASILAASEYPKNSRCRLVLQPQSMQDVLRRYLADNGFSIEKENVVFDGGKYYQLISAVYDGTKRQFSDCQYKLGKINLERAEHAPTDADIGWLRGQLASARRRIEGRLNGAADTAEQSRDLELASVIDKILAKVE